MAAWRAAIPSFLLVPQTRHGEAVRVRLAASAEANKRRASLFGGALLRRVDQQRLGS